MYFCFERIQPPPPTSYMTHAIPRPYLPSTSGCSSVATEWVKGRTIEDCLTIKNTDIAGHLKLPPVKLHCSMLAEDAIKAAIKDYATKNGIKVETLKAATATSGRT